mgnify:CR=1 FL=1
MTIEQQAVTQELQRPVLKMQRNSRMGGSMPVWDQPRTATERTESRLAQALADPGVQGSPFQMALVETASTHHAHKTAEPFGFGDIVDMVNPLHHIPVVGTLYREATGDDIRGAGRVIGGAVFGGGAGAGASLVNTVVEHETGRDIPTAVMHYARTEMLSEDNTEQSRARNEAEERLNAAFNEFERGVRDPINEVRF